MRKRDYEKMTPFEQIQQGLHDGIAHARGRLSLRTTVLPAGPPAASPKRVAALRRKLGMSQSVFAALLNVSPKLVQSWEQGVRTPMRADLRLLQIIENSPAIVGPLLPLPSGRRSAGAAGGATRTTKPKPANGLEPTTRRRSSAA